jgi:hypothetical protein
LKSNIEERLDEHQGPFSARLVTIKMQSGDEWAV